MQCIECSNEFDSRRSTSKYCSARCRKLAFLGVKKSGAVLGVSVPKELSIPDLAFQKVVSVPEDLSVPDMRPVEAIPMSELREPKPGIPIVRADGKAYHYRLVPISRRPMRLVRVGEGFVTRDLYGV